MEGGGGAPPTTNRVDTKHLTSTCDGYLVGAKVLEDSGRNAGSPGKDLGLATGDLHLEHVFQLSHYEVQSLDHNVEDPLREAASSKGDIVNVDFNPE